MMENDVKKINAEVLAVIMTLGQKYINKLPNEVIETILKNADMSLMPKIDQNKPIEEHTNISKEARAFLCMLKLKYWCKSEEDRQNLLQILNTNQKNREQSEIEEENLKREKYNPNNIFNNENN